MVARGPGLAGRAPRWHDRRSMRSSRSDSGAPLLFVLGALVAIRAALAFVPGTWAWSLQLQRYAGSPFAWTLWALAALSLAPPLARIQGPALAGLGRALDTAPRRTALLFALAVAGVVLALPDHTWFTGDFLLRVGLLGSSTDLARIAPQS